MLTNDPQQSHCVTLPDPDWQLILAGLYELPGKICVPVISRLQAELARMPEPEAQDATVTPLLGAAE